MLFQRSGSWESGRCSEGRETADGGRKPDQILEAGALGTHRLAQPDLCGGRRDPDRRGKGVRGGDGGVAPRCRNLVLAGLKDPEGEAALGAVGAAAPMGCADLARSAPSRAAQGSLFPDATRRHVRD